MAKPHAVVERYWTALANADGEAMAACYAKSAEFRDEVFDLHGDEVGAMWRMLFSPTNQVAMKVHPLVRDGAVTKGTWEATYVFSATGRTVRNVVRSTFTVKGGKIVAQRDRFPFWKWSRMALGTKGLLLGWTPLVRGAVRKGARKQLAKFMAK